MVRDEVLMSDMASDISDMGSAMRLWNKPLESTRAVQKGSQAQLMVNTIKWWSFHVSLPEGSWFGKLVVSTSAKLVVTAIQKIQTNKCSEVDVELI